MYRVLCDGVPIHDLRDEELILIDPKLELEINKAGSFSFKMPPQHPQYDLPKRMRSCIQVYQDDLELFNGRIIETTVDFYNRKQCECEGQLAFLNDSIQRPAEYHDITVRGYLETLINNHNEQVKENSVALTFNSQCAGESATWDYFSLYYKKDGIVYVALNKVRANTLAGNTYTIPSNEFYVYWHTDSTANGYYGFKIDEIRASSEMALAGTKATLPSYTVIEAKSIDDIQTPHNPYENSVNKLWHYTYSSSEQSWKEFKVGIVTVKDSNDSLYRYTNYNSTMTEIKEDLVDDLGGYLRVRNTNGVHYLDYINLEDYGDTNTQSIEFGENLIDFSRNTDVTDIATAIIPLGAKLEESPIEALEQRLTIESVNEGSDCLYSPEAVENFGMITKTVTWDNVTTPEMLKSKATKWLTDYQFDEMTLEVKAIDLHFTDDEIMQLKLGDKIRVHSAAHGLDKYFPLTKMSIQLNSPSSNTITLGTTINTGLSAKTNTASSVATKAIDTIPIPSNIVKQAIDQATALITAATHGHVVTTAEEQLIMDTNDIETATKVWRWNLNGLGYSNTGYNGTYATAITMDGQIVGDRIVGNSISGEKLDITYRNQVIREIADAEESARSDAEDYTDSELKNYYTKSEVETSIKNTKDSILLSAKETAEQYVDGKLKNYSTSAQIKVKTDSIESEVSKKLNSSDLSTKIQQNAYAVKIAWNNISKYIQFESGELRIYDSAATSTQKLVSKFDYNGSHFYRDNYYIGKIGTNSWSGDSSYRGLVFDLENSASYMCWAAKDSSSSYYYDTKLIYHHNGNKYPKGLHFSCDTYSDGYLWLADDVRVMDWNNGGCGIRGSMTWCNNSNSSSVEINGQNKSFSVYNGVSIDFYSTLNLHGWGYTNNSDVRLKTNIKDTAIRGLEVVNAIDLKEFDWIQSGEHQAIGIIAQQIQSFAPELISEDANDGHLKLNTDKLVYYCIKAIQELCKKEGLKYDKPIYTDPYTYLDKKTFIAKMNPISVMRDSKEHEPIKIMAQGKG